MFHWKRVLNVKFTSSKLGKQIVYTSELGSGLDISISGTKYISVLKDKCLIQISNLTYKDIATITSGEYTDVEVEAGYSTTGKFTIFKGSVLFVSNSLNSDRTITVNFICVSEFVGKTASKRINKLFNSGLNFYTIFKELSAYQGITSVDISESLKENSLQNATSVSGSISDWLDEILTNNINLIASTDSASGKILTLFDITKDERPVINIGNSLINLSNGYPRCTSNGLVLNVIPTRNFSCGDIIKIDNSIVDTSVTNESEALTLPARYLDVDGEYVVYEVNYTLNNRSDEYTIELSAKSYNLMKQIS